ncbi:MAG: hypothetical protein EXQ92_08670 [Alphaproteobacteria bacterium]|nr:hypothetical protein [Alphaproteobacteria bacterium]
MTRTTIAATVLFDVITRTDTTSSNSIAGASTTGSPVTQNAYQTPSLSLALDIGPPAGGPPAGGPPAGGGTITASGGTTTEPGGQNSSNLAASNQGGGGQVLVRGLLNQGPVPRQSFTSPGGSPTSASLPGFGNPLNWGPLR